APSAVVTEASGFSDVMPRFRNPDPPAPSPNIIRPLESRSTVATAAAVTTGCTLNGSGTNVPKRTPLVRAAAGPSTANMSRCIRSFDTHASSKPSASASTTALTASGPDKTLPTPTPHVSSRSTSDSQVCGTDGLVGFNFIGRAGQDDRPLL